MAPITSTAKSIIVATGIFLILYVSSASSADNHMLSKMLQKIEQTHNARTYKIEAAEYKGRQVYEIETLRNGDFYESFIDPQSGQILSDEKEETMFWTPLSDDQKRAFEQTKISLWQAIEAVSEKKNSPIEEASFQIDNNNSYFEIIFEDGAKYLIDGMSGDLQ
ncbi:PepSY domain-containing protein [Thalassospira sp.]|uniref:PepSY domain-containing protein n=1 Tax=Thalassospira sp. TaxID=1912094 RepID=UPI00273345D8|nr:PepSY domain-containing protein [Thalassospira sp.]MDP2699764.1 PepSY domain-containing protein [Thalassospira sp.]